MSCLRSSCSFTKNFHEECCYIFYSSDTCNSNIVRERSLYATPSLVGIPRWYFAKNWFPERKVGGGWKTGAIPGSRGCRSCFQQGEDSRAWDTTFGGRDRQGQNNCRHDGGFSRKAWEAVRRFGNYFSNFDQLTLLLSLNLNLVYVPSHFLCLFSNIKVQLCRYIRWTIKEESWELSLPSFKGL